MFRSFTFTYYRINSSNIQVRWTAETRIVYYLYGQLSPTLVILTLVRKRSLQERGDMACEKLATEVRELHFAGNLESDLLMPGVVRRTVIQIRQTCWTPDRNLLTTRKYKDCILLGQERNPNLVTSTN